MSGRVSGNERGSGSERGGERGSGSERGSERGSGSGKGSGSVILMEIRVERIGTVKGGEKKRVNEEEREGENDRLGEERVWSDEL